MRIGKRLYRVLRESRVVHMVGGIAIGLLGAGILALLLNYVVQPLSYRATQGMNAEREQRFTLWYWDQSPSAALHEQLFGEIRSAYERLLTTLEVDDDQVPRPINVLVHDTVDQLTASVVQRKSSLNEQRLSAPMDLLVGVDPTGPLTELVAAYAWGECQSKILQNGLRAAITEDRDVHAIVAAAGDRQLTLDGLLAIEETLQPSLYQLYASPYSSSMIGTLSDIAGLMNVQAEGGASLNDLPSMHAASLVRFILEEFGMLDLRRAWGSGSTARLLGRLDIPLDELDRRWRTATEQARERSPRYPYYAAYFDLLQGRPDTAFAAIRGWPSPLGEDAAELAIRCSLLVGEIETAESYLDALPASPTRSQLAALVAAFTGWIAVEDGRCRALAPAELRAVAEQRAAAAQGTIDTIAAALALDPAALPERVTLVIHRSATTADAAPALLPEAGADATVLELVQASPPDELAWTLGELVPQLAYGARSLSQLVRAGVASALLNSRERLVRHACELLANDAWIWLERLDFNRSDTENVVMEAGLLFRYVLDTCGPEAIARVWTMTARQPRPASLETALEDACGMGREEIEDALFETVLDCR
jgi:hypothetical protein